MNDSFQRQLFHYMALMFLAVLALAPIWVMIATSFKNDIDVQDSTPLWFFFVPTLDNYEYILTRGKFDRYLTNSIIVGTASTFMTLLLGGFCAYALARTAFRGRNLTRDEMHGYANLTFAGGRDTVINTISSIIGYIAENPAADLLG